MSSQRLLGTGLAIGGQVTPARRAAGPLGVCCAAAVAYLAVRRRRR